MGRGNLRRKSGHAAHKGAKVGSRAVSGALTEAVSIYAFKQTATLCRGKKKNHPFIAEDPPEDDIYREKWQREF